MSIPIRSAALPLLAASALTSSFVLTTAPAHAMTGACHPRGRDLSVKYSTDGVSWRPYAGPVKAGPAVLLRTRAVDGRVSRISPVGLPVWRTGTVYPAGALVDHRGEIYRATRAGTSAAPDTAPSSWAPVG